MIEEDPTQRLGLLDGIRKRKLVVLVDMLGEPKRDTGTLKQIMRRTALVELDRRGDSTVRVHLEEPFFLLLIILEGDAFKVVAKVRVGVLEFFEEDGCLVSVRGAGGEELEGGGALLEFRMGSHGCECSQGSESTREQGHGRVYILQVVAYPRADQ